MKKYYHITPKRNLPSIMKHGLIPQAGKRSKQLKEEEAVFLFPSLEDLGNALCNWFGDCFDEDEILVSLEVHLPDSFPVENGAVGYEKISKTVIPPCYVRLLRDE